MKTHKEHKLEQELKQVTADFIQAQTMIRLMGTVIMEQADQLADLLGEK